MKVLIKPLLPLLFACPACAGPALDSLSGQAAAVAAPAAVPQPAAAPLKDWTVMVYMNGKSNIEPYALNDINRFETVGSSDKVNIVVELGRSKGLANDTTADGDWAGVRRYYVIKDADKNHIASPVLADLGNADMGDWKQAADFLKWARAAYPAKRYMFMIWDHGWGWIDPTNFTGKAAARSISHDFVTGHSISTLDLGKIFQEGGKVDMYASMACFMQMAEVAYQIKDSADVIVGSEEVIQLSSLNFEDFFTQLEANPAEGPEAAGSAMVDTFKEMYSRPENADMLAQTKYGTQLSAIRAAALPELAAKAKIWYTLAMADDDKQAFAKAKKDVLRFEMGDETTDPDKQISFYGDLYNFAELADRYADPARPGAKEMTAAGEALEKFITGGLTIRSAWVGKDRTGKEYSNTHGISIDIPGKPGNIIEYRPTYSSLDFVKASGWDKFTAYLGTISE
jgi:hypothetical protein